MSQNPLNEAVAQATAAVAADRQEPTQIPVSTRFPHPPPPGKTVAWVVPGLSMATKFTSLVEAAAEAIDWRLLPVPFDVADPANVNEAVEKAVDQHVDYIGVLAAPSALFESGLAKANAAGIPVVLYAVETELDGPERGIIGCFSCSYSSQRVGKTFANFVISDSQGQGHGVCIDVVEQPALHETAEAFVEHLNQHGGECRGSLIRTSQASMKAGRIGAQALTYLQANPSAGYVVLLADGIADDLPALLRSAGLAENVKILYGVAPTVASIEKIADGSTYAALEYAGQSNFWLLMYGLAAHSLGLPEFLQVDGPTTDLAYVLRTASNIPNPVSKWAGLPNYQQQYLDLMGISSTASTELGA